MLRKNRTDTVVEIIRTGRRLTEEDINRLPSTISTRSLLGRFGCIPRRERMTREQLRARIAELEAQVQQPAQVTLGTYSPLSNGRERSQ